MGLSWQLLTVHYNYGGNLTALFCTGMQLPIPPTLEREHIYVFRGSTGYDGQVYHYMAHDPLYRTEIGRSLGDPGFRYRRILLPAMAYALVLGHQEWIDRSYFVCNLLFLLIGSWWLATILVNLGLHPGFAALYVLVPAAIMSLDRMTVDLALTSLVLGFVVYSSTQCPRRLYLILVLAALCRDTGFILAIACAIPPLVARRFRESLLWLSPLVPAVLWYGFVRWKIGPGNYDPITPLTALWEAMLHPPHYPFSPAVTAGVRVFDGLLTFGMVMGIVLGLRRLREAVADPIRASLVLWAILGILLPRSVWAEFYGGARILSPLLLLEFLRSFPERGWIDRLPLLFASPRIWIQMLPQVGGVLRALTGVSF